MSEQYSSLAEYYAKEYLDKIFYFCLKKTGSAEQAQDLTQEISLCVLEELADGVIPDHFHAWVWQICRNRYARWAERKHKQSDASSGWDVTDLAEADQPASESPETALIAKEEQELLRRELAFTAGEYREILIAYYFEQKRVSEIASKLSISESAVKQRLHRARNKLKEGMNMARTFGKKSITPERINYIGSGNHTSSGLPDSALNRMIPQNIVIEAHNNPSTAEELAMELGIALPYMEEEIRLLHDASLLKKTDDGKYVTNFFIADKDTQAAITAMSIEAGKEVLPAIKSLIGEMKEKLLAAGVKPDSMSESDFLWLVSIECSRRVNQSVYRPDLYFSFERPDGGNWGILGYEEGYADAMNGLGHNGGIYDRVGIEFWVHCPRDFGFCQPDERMGHQLIFSHRCYPLIRDILDGRRTVADFSENERAMWDTDMGRYVHEENGQTVFDLPIYRGNIDKLWGEELQKCDAYAAAKEICVKLDQRIQEYLRSITDPNLHKQIEYVSLMMGKCPTAILGNLFAAGELVLPENAPKSNATCYLVVR